MKPGDAVYVRLKAAPQIGQYVFRHVMKTVRGVLARHEPTGKTFKAYVPGDRVERAEVPGDRVERAEVVTVNPKSVRLKLPDGNVIVRSLDQVSEIPV